MKSLFCFTLLLSGFISAQISHAGDGKTFAYCSEGSPSSFNPQLATDGASFNAGARTVYSRLVEFKMGTTQVRPGLAEKWDISKDGLTYTFKLRKGVKFHSNAQFKPKKEFSADDVLFSFNRQRLKEHPFHKVGGGVYEYFSSMEMSSIIKDIVKVDDHTVKFVLSRVEAPFLADLAMDFASIHSSEYADAMMKAGTPDLLDTAPIGTGPFVFNKYLKDQMIRYEQNPDYFGGKGALDKLVFVITTDASVRFQKLKTGECQLIAYPAPADLPAMKKDPKLRVMEQAGLNVGYLAMNVEKAPFNNKLVRKAIALSLNRKSYIDAVYLGNAIQAKNPIPPSMWSYHHSIKDLAYDPEKAKALLKEAGFPNGFSTELWTVPVARPYIPNGKRLGEMMQADLAKVGIQVKLVTYDWPTYLEKTRLGQHTLAQMGWTGDNGDPDNFLNVLLSCAGRDAGTNIARFCHPSFEKLVKAAKQTANVTERTKLYKKAQELFQEELPWVTIAHAQVFRAMSEKVQGYQIDPFGSDYFFGVSLK